MRSLTTDTQHRAAFPAHTHSRSHIPQHLHNKVSDPRRTHDRLRHCCSLELHRSDIILPMSKYCTCFSNNLMKMQGLCYLCCCHHSSRVMKTNRRLMPQSLLLQYLTTMKHTQAMKQECSHLIHFMEHKLALTPGGSFCPVEMACTLQNLVHPITLECRSVAVACVTYIYIYVGCSQQTKLLLRFTSCQ